MNNELYEKLEKIQWLLHKYRMKGLAEGGPMFDMTRGRGRILAVLKLRDGISTKELSYLLGVAVSSLNELLSKLEKGGYIFREPSEQDKRVMLVRLTDKGRATEQPESADFGDIFSCLSVDERTAFGAYLDRIIDSMKKNWGFDDDEFERMKEAFEHFAGEHDRHFCGGFRGRFGGLGHMHGFNGDRRRHEYY
jgi:DNA-binding MarR family transcriptional regulator